MWYGNRGQVSVDRSAVRIGRSPDDLNGRTPAGSIAAVRPLVIVELQVALERALEVASFVK
jgi:hypothetical protein